MFLQQLRIEKFHTRVKRTRSLDRLAVEVSFIGDLLLFFRQQVSKHRPFMISTSTRFRNRCITVDFYLISESLQFLLQIIFPFLLHFLDKIFRTEFLILASIFQYMPYRFQDRVSYCYQSSFLASAGCQSVITCAVKGILGTGSRPCGLCDNGL